MIYLFHGSDTDRARRAAFEWVAKARAKEPQLIYTRVTREELSEGLLGEVEQSGGLFVSRMLVLLDDPFQKTAAADDAEEGETMGGAGGVVAEHVELLAASDNAIVLLASTLSAPLLKKLVPKVAKEYRFDAPTQSVKRGFNSSLVDALGARSGTRLWLELIRALRAGDAPEMLHGLLHWKARDLMQKGGRAWRPDEARKLSLELISLLQQSRRGGLPLAPALERFALSVSSASSTQQ